MIRSIVAVKSLKRLRQIIGRKLRAAREENGFATQADLAVALGVDRTRVTKWETGAALPEGQNREALVKALNLKPDFFDVSSPNPDDYKRFWDLVERLDKVALELSEDDESDEETELLKLFRSGDADQRSALLDQARAIVGKKRKRGSRKTGA